jgi:hypothetical protein
MIQKYIIQKNNEKNELKISEYAELDKGIFSLLCEETYEDKNIAEAISKGKDMLINVLRTPNMYPQSIYALKMAEAIIELLDDDNEVQRELLFNDKEVYLAKKTDPEATDELESDVLEIDELLEDDLEVKPIENLPGNLDTAVEDPPDLKKDK